MRGDAVSRPDGAGEMVACLMVFCAEHGISADSDAVLEWLDTYWLRRFATLDAEARLAAAVTSRVDLGSLFPTIVVCEPGNRCGDLACPVCGAH